jgi:fermentation-respiration switch protein FrsA (DUF1100 family)
VIHGRRDEIVPFRHGEALFEKSLVKYPPFWVDGAGHNNVEKYAYDYLDKINEFIRHLDSL